MTDRGPTALTSLNSTWSPEAVRLDPLHRKAAKIRQTRRVRRGIRMNMLHMRTLGQARVLICDHELLFISRQVHCQGNCFVNSQ